MNYFSRVINGRVCLTEDCTRLLPAERSSCRYHYFTSAAAHPDPLAPYCGDVDEWWEQTSPRRHKLEQLQNSAISRWVRLRARNELSAIRSHMARQLVTRVVADWRGETRRPEWQLPPDGWILARIRQDYPDIELEPNDPAPYTDGFSEASRMDEFLDRKARVDHAASHPYCTPFRPITERRCTDEKRIADLAAQDRRNASVLGDHAEALHAAKHDNYRVALKEVFADPGADTTVPDGVVAFHQIEDPVGMETLYSTEKDRWSFARHMGLRAGDVVRYDHARAATLEADCLRNLGKTKGTPVGLNSGNPETMLRLELAPFRGLYVGDALCELAKSHLSAELELLLPAGTYWKVAAIVDAEHPVGWRHGSKDYKRLRTIQMIEITPAAARATSIQRMTATDEELKALTPRLQD